MGMSSSNCEFVKLIIRLVGGGVAPSSQTVESLLSYTWLAKLASGIDNHPMKNHYFTNKLTTVAIVSAQIH